MYLYKYLFIIDHELQGAIRNVMFFIYAMIIFEGIIIETKQIKGLQI